MTAAVLEGPAEIGRRPLSRRQRVRQRQGGNRLRGWRKAKASLDKAIREASEKVGPWTLHDLRRTFATNLAALGTPIHVTEKLLGHVAGTVSGAAAIYSRHAYRDEMRAAITAYEARLAAFVA